MTSLLLTDCCTPKSTQTRILHVPVPVPVQGIPKSTFDKAGQCSRPNCTKCKMHIYRSSSALIFTLVSLQIFCETACYGY